jgi:GalNAc-alpha-(1->4)-GalNAc-alpha-(1->3)-diNAcBac-PP-undecaprenol alpha-1,4-N-acetyl-D-galactosaminyltransferase
MRICCVIGSLTSGGAERVMSVLCERWAHDGHDVTLVTFAGTTDDFYPLPSSVARVGLGLDYPPSSSFAWLQRSVRRVTGLRRVVRERRPDVILAFMTIPNLTAIIASMGLGVPVVISERVYPPAEVAAGEIPWILSIARRLLYRLANAIVVQTSITASWAVRYLRVRDVHVIPNPLAREFVGVRPTVATSREKRIVAMGRLESQKGFDVLVKAFAQVHARFPGWRLTILGRGSEDASLRALGESLGTSFELAGATSNPASELLRAQVYVLSSRYEGFPNALLEAMACGCAVVSTACPTGPAEIIDDGVSGLLVPVDDAATLAAAIDRLLADDTLRDKLAAEAVRSASHYEPQLILPQWTQLLEHVVRESGPRRSVPGTPEIH